MAVNHIQQRGIGYCLPASAQMAAAQFGKVIPRARITRTLGTIPGLGTPFSAIERLVEFRFVVEIAEWFGVDSLLLALSEGIGVIAAILTSHDLPGWGNQPTQHIVLVTAIEAGRVYILRPNPSGGTTYYDPTLVVGPVDVSEDAFGLAWSEMSELTALIRLA